MIEDNSGKPILQISCLSELHQSTITLCDLYDALPVAKSVKPDFIHGGYDEEKDLHRRMSKWTAIRKQIKVSCNGAKAVRNFIKIPHLIPIKLLLLNIQTG
jgi:hypothetical protein